MDLNDVSIRAVPQLVPELAELRGFRSLAQEAREDGWAFVDRLARDWADGRNRFDKPGECCHAVWLADCLIAVGGLNLDPYAHDAETGRLRHIYVRLDWRRHGIGRALVGALLTAPHGFRRVRLRTEGLVAAAFYERLGFSPVTSPEATHVLDL